MMMGARGVMIEEMSTEQQPSKARDCRSSSRPTSDELGNSTTAAKKSSQLCLVCLALGQSTFWISGQHFHSGRPSFAPIVASAKVFKVAGVTHHCPPLPTNSGQVPEIPSLIRPASPTRQAQQASAKASFPHSQRCEIIASPTKLCHLWQSQWNESKNNKKQPKAKKKGSLTMQMQNRSNKE